MSGNQRVHSPYRGARVLVSGATGLIGSRLVRRLLEEGAEVHALTIPDLEPESELVRGGDIRRIVSHVGRLEIQPSVEEAVKDSVPHFVFHLGAQPLVGVAKRDPVGTFAANVAGTWHLLEACRRLEQQPLALAVASSDKAYGATDKLPYVETDPVGGSEEPYEASKAITDIISRTYASTYGLPVRIARCGNVYGRGDWNWSRIIPGTIRSLLRAERPVVRSDGTNVRDYVHVDDVAEGYLLLGAHDLSPGEVFNFSSGQRRTVLEVIDCIQSAMGTDLKPIIKDEARGEIPVQYLDSSKARDRLGWTPVRRLAESLPSIIQWYEELLRND